MSNRYNTIPSFDLYDTCRLDVIWDGTEDKTMVMHTMVTYSLSDEGETDESEHIAHSDHRETASDVIDWKNILNPGEELSRKEVIKKCEGLGYTARTLDRELKKAKDTGILKSPKNGIYSL